MEDLKRILKDTGCEEDRIRMILDLREEEQLKELRKQRCILLEQIHEEQRKIDRLDDLIRKKGIKQ